MKSFKLSKVHMFALRLLALGLLALGLPTAYAEFISTSPVQSKEFGDLGWLGWLGLLGLLGLLGRLYRPDDRPDDKAADRNIVVGGKHK